MTQHWGVGTDRDATYGFVGCTQGQWGRTAGAQLTQLISHVPAAGLCVAKAKSIIV